MTDPTLQEADLFSLLKLGKTRAKRLAKLFELNAPNQIIRNEIGLVDQITKELERRWPSQ